MLTQAKVKELFNYDPETGDLIWKVDLYSNKIKGKVAGSLHVSGYKHIQINGKKFKAHRLVWLWHHGFFTSKQIDHINGRPSDNRVENLREATRSQNMQNQHKAHTRNRSGYLGVRKQKQKWCAIITSCFGKRIYLGAYDTPEEAHEAYLAKKRELHEFNTL